LTKLFQCQFFFWCWTTRQFIAYIYWVFSKLWRWLLLSFVILFSWCNCSSIC